jgi:hypothetical protein
MKTFFSLFILVFTACMILPGCQGSGKPAEEVEDKEEGPKSEEGKPADEKKAPEPKEKKAPAENRKERPGPPIPVMPAEEPSTCQVHKEPLVLKGVKVFHGTVPCDPDYEKAKVTHFPHGDDPILATDRTRNKVSVMRKVCPACSKARAAWMEKQESGNPGGED